ncbi:MAG: Crp/Fnr family transcriptional regulator [Flavobacteriales bacterium CG_4_9_14_0_2_um_filter_35_242]|nr:Crp/Fnr family transcriptional regulator [Zetaproteobacteria bacterium]OIO11298.1 MAG: Crp/Fnr family transcriptional regulator [Flavobacteriaceae bacterium CG1_02_35_72]PIR14001.1 MAG: Crp/Fnr family transcriptional regulator [Flavobacteriales bacterium CG11_big_fil_rev_8_21_14_0_20_35_7]PIV19469.1 MAG: Crp/Fnr family transcriptional regulator [Flavobacteriales bacterium CG03_land_8_20_14_0_80_35_15]PIX07603.1 MAG: Crp/Fnr family transcriptional regulator [Flavobacteriales bacterium CG_4_8_
MTKCDHCMIRELNSFNSLTRDELVSLDEKRTIIHVKRGQPLFVEGTVLNGIYCLQSGECKVSKLTPNGKDQIVRFIKEGEIVGHKSILSGTSAKLSVTALEDMDVCFIPKQELLDLFAKNKEFSLELTRSLCQSLDKANLTVATMAQKNVRERLAEFLLYFERMFGVDEKGFIAVKLTREEIANAIGTATESAIRLLSEFKHDGFILLHGKQIKLLDKPKLIHISDGF